jgi:hypothetical protein
MDYSGVDIVVVIDSSGNLDKVYTPTAGEKIAALNWTGTDEDEIRESVAFSGMPQDVRNKFTNLINTEKRHYHFGCEGRAGDKRIHRDLESAMVELKAALEEADAEKQENWYIYTCANDCEGIID